MLDCRSFYETLTDLDVSFFAGVPDSLLKYFCAFVTDHAESSNHIIAANEGAAVALAAGHHIATGKLPLVYLQNSGLGNMVNPLTSLTDPEVYSIPLLMLIGWRGEPGVPDEPQHRKQGRITPALLDALEIPYKVLPQETAEAQAILSEAAGLAWRSGAPVAILVRKGTFAPYSLRTSAHELGTLSREDAIRTIIAEIEDDAVVISTTGMASREVFELRAANAAGHHRDFLTVGCMGHASQIALTIAAEAPSRSVYCIDGDGSVLMHMGSMAIIGSQVRRNFRHIVLNNGAHDSVGGQPTAGNMIDLPLIARACGYQSAASTANVQELKASILDLKQTDGPNLLEVRIRRGARKDLGRPTSTPRDNKHALMQFLGSAK